MNHAGLVEAGDARAAARAAMFMGASIREEGAAPRFHFDVEVIGPSEADRAHYVDVRDRLASLKVARAAVLGRRIEATIVDLERELALVPLQRKWQEQFCNLVTTPGKNDLLDKYFSGSAYTAAWYAGLIGITGYSAIAAADTMASHAGWTESAAYSNANRPTLAFAAAGSGSKSTSSAAAFAINATDTIKGLFTSTSNTKSGTTGILYSAGLFTGGDRAVANGDQLNCSGSWSI